MTIGDAEVEVSVIKFGEKDKHKNKPKLLNKEVNYCELRVFQLVLKVTAEVALDRHLWKLREYYLIYFLSYHPISQKLKNLYAITV